jgi:hypothetical protein
MYRLRTISETLEPSAPTGHLPVAMSLPIPSYTEERGCIRTPQPKAELEPAIFVFKEQNLLMNLLICNTEET